MLSALSVALTVLLTVVGFVSSVSSASESLIFSTASTGTSDAVTDATKPTLADKVVDKIESFIRTGRIKPEARQVKGLYLTASSAANPAKVDEIIRLINRTELNAVVIDIKDYTGKILYDSSLDIVERHGTESVVIPDLKRLIKKLHKHNIYVIARQTVFQDPLLAARNAAWAIKNKSGGLWRDKLGLAWVDPTSEDVWSYNTAIAKEAIRLGFDEINFDYVRFPSDGNLSQVVYTTGNKPRHEVMRDFFRFLNDELAGRPAWISLDVFGFVMERHDGMSIGQRLEDMVDEADYICPMMYPSHYPSGHLGLKNPAASPRLIIENGLKKGLPYFEGKRAHVRPWIQAFHMGAYYDAVKIRAEIDAVEKYTDAGWLMWNSANKYTDAGLKKEQI